MVVVPDLGATHAGEKFLCRVGASAVLARRDGATQILRQVKHGLRLSDQVEGTARPSTGSRANSAPKAIISKLKGSRYRSGRTRDWVKVKNPDSPAVKREAEEDGGL
jgi:ATP-dependent DNA ligase